MTAIDELAWNESGAEIKTKKSFVLFKSYHARSNGLALAFPDICASPESRVSVVPVPYPNMARTTETARGSKKTEVKADSIRPKSLNRPTVQIPVEAPAVTLENQQEILHYRKAIRDLLMQKK